MKTLKFNHRFAQLILKGQKNSTWRMYDDKDLSVNDDFKIIDKLDSSLPDSWTVIGQGRIKEITEKKLGDVSEMEIASQHPGMSKSRLVEHYRAFYGDRVTGETPVKIITFDFQPTSGDVPTPAMLLEEAKLYTDGGSRGNPGQSACAYVIRDTGDVIVEKAGFYLGMATNNQAEYIGLQKGLERVRELGISRVILFSDSQLVVNQMNGLYRVKNQELAPLNKEVNEIAAAFEKISFVHVPRELNKDADREVNRILDEQEKRAK